MKSYEQLALLAVYTRHFEQALQWNRFLLQLDPYNSKHAAQRAKIYLLAGAYKKSYRVYAPFIQQAAHVRADDLLHMGLLLGALKQYRKSLYYFNAARNKDQHCVAAYNNAAISSIKLGHNKEARTLLTLSLLIDPTQKKIQSMLSSLAYKNG